MQRVGWLVGLFLFVKTSEAKEKQRSFSDFHFASLIFVPTQRELHDCRKKWDNWVVTSLAILCDLKLLNP